MSIETKKDEIIDSITDLSTKDIDITMEEKREIIQQNKVELNLITLREYAQIDDFEDELEMNKRKALELSVTKISEKYSKTLWIHRSYLEKIIRAWIVENDKPESWQPTRLSKSAKEITSEEIKKCKKHASDALYEYIKDRFNWMPSQWEKRMYLWPNIDLARWYIFWVWVGIFSPINEFEIRKWKSELNKVYWPKSQWDNEITALLEIWYPIIWPKEMREINMIGYFARREVEDLRENLFWIVKHFPGWDETLNQTHIENVHFEYWNPYVIESISWFKKIINSKSPPKWIMLSLATYDKEYFPWIDNIIKRDAEKYPHILWVKFEDIPAAINPYIVTYLREILWYKWIIIPDWIWWKMRWVDDFVDKIDLPFTKDENTKKIFLCIMAGNNFISWFNAWEIMEQLNNDEWEELKNYPKLYDAFLSKLRICIQPYVQHVNDLWLDISLDIQTIIALLMTDTDEKIWILEKDRWEFEYSNNKRWKKRKEISMKDFLLKKWRKISEDKWNKVFANTIFWYWLKQNDIWSRTWIQVLIFRIEFVKRFYFLKTWEELKIEHEWIWEYDWLEISENRWLEIVMSNNDFREIYDNISWEDIY